MLAAFDSVARSLQCDLTITSACDGEHSGPNDPHHRGEAYDIRSHDFANKESVLQAVMNELGTEKFFGFLEDPGTENEHFHFQVRKGGTYP